MQTITPSQWRPQAWKNGRGTTSEVLRLPALDDFDLRISVAAVTDSGPFSLFPGYTRWSLLLDGGPVWLGERRLTALSQLDGTLPIDARVEAPARLLNILGRGIAVGVGEEEADIVFDLATHETRIFERPTRARGVWIKR
jgi:environmental stress-induced protein Ves